MLDGRYPSQRVRRAAAPDRLGPGRRHDPGPPRRPPAGGHQRRHDPRPRAVRRHAARRPPRRRARRGDGLRGPARARRSCSARRTWRIEEIGRDRVIVTPAPGLPGAVPFWKGDTLGRPRELGEAIGAFARWAVDQSPETLERDYDLDERAARNLVEFLARAAAGHAGDPVRPRDRRRALPRRDRRLAAVRADPVRRPRPRRLVAGAELRGSATGWGSSPTRSTPTTGSSSTCPTPRSRRAPTWCMLEPDEIEDLVVAELGSSALFGARFRENAGRALLIPRARPGQAHAAVAAAAEGAVAARGGQEVRRVPDRAGDLPRVPARRARRARAGRAADPAAPPRDHAGRGRDADRVAVRLLAAVRLRRHLHVRGRHAQRRAARGGAVAGPRPAARAARPGGAARPDRPGRAGARRGRPAVPVGADARHRPRRPARRAAPGRRPDARRGRGAGARRARPRRDARASCAASGGPPGSGVNGEERWIDAADAGLYRDALGVAPPGGLPAAFLEDVPDALRAAAAPLRRHPRPVHRPPTCGPATGSTPPRRCASWSASGDLVRGELRPGGSEREWCDPEVLRRLRRASLAVLRKEIEPAEARELARFLPAWQGVDRHPASGAGIDRLREVLVPLQGLALPAEVWERDVLPRRVGAYSPSWMDQLCAAGELVWIGAGALGRNSGRVALYFREDLALLGPPPYRGGGARRRGARGGARAAGSAARASSPTCWSSWTLSPRGDPGGAVGPGLGGRGHQRRVRAAAGAAADAGARPARADRARARRGARRAGSGPARRRGAELRRRSRAAGR